MSSKLWIVPQSPSHNLYIYRVAHQCGFSDVEEDMNDDWRPVHTYYIYSVSHQYEFFDAE